MKLALITGGSKGLGAALVQWHLDQGWTVREYSRSGQGDVHVPCDFSAQDAGAAVLEGSFAELAQHPWDVLRLINNAGTLDPIGPLTDSEPSQWRAHLQINVAACVTATGLFLKHFSLSQAPQTVVNISSGAAVTPYHGWSLYCASKAALEAFTRCVALEQAAAAAPVIVVAIRPGVIETGMQAAIRAQDSAHFAQVEKFRKLSAEGLLQSPAEAAQRVCGLLARGVRSGEVYDVRDLG